MTKHNLSQTPYTKNSEAENDSKRELASDKEVADNKQDKVTKNINGKTDIVQEQDSLEIKSLHPFVHWAQSQTHVSLRIDLIQVENLDVAITDDGICLKFFARGRGAHGLQDYDFSLNFHSEVEKKFNCHTIERYVLLLIKKVNQQVNWPRLTKEPTKLPWLRFDFDRYAGSDSDDNITDENNERNIELLNREQSFELLQQQQQLREAQEKNKFGTETNNIYHQQKKQATSNSLANSLDNIVKNKSKTDSDIFNPFNKRAGKNRDSANMKHDYRRETVTMDTSKNTAKHALTYKKTYLFLYNLVMFIMFLKVYLVLIIKGLSGTADDDTVQGAAFIINILTYTQLLETVHPMLGLVPGGPLMPFIQVVGRLLVNYFLTEPTVRLNSSPYAHYLFIVWSSIEIFRYSFYALRVFKVNIYALTWCRYTLFLPLYPMGGFCESMVIMSTIKYYEKTGQYSFELPNSANISFSLPMTLRIYIYVLLWPTIYSLMKYMWKQRCKQLKEKVE